MKNNYYSVTEVQEILDVSKSKAYEIIRVFYEELKEKNYLVLRGKVPKKYFNEKIYGGITI